MIFRKCQSLFVVICFADVEMNEDKSEGSENEDCEELEKATQNVHVNVSYCIFISACINPSVPGLSDKLKTNITYQSAKTCLECLKLQILH